ncbi:Putative metallo-beta-lactamase, ribonuclease Z/Hydroxyacylglutathione hydrolase [Colletotrichum destructivum]|uniref:Metallo-beta-lactamase, ribonuclease Z/Hydroxyacylglutathione hydrolase n=1 Tax=Colletotrichum destructivum TaxID=34406 RepID=A0AAX4I7G8_9PEZI|nr:Putative metallo-beta-lactamase, ribonuclease Z/Hydroxyacylglutathione hydrolase [Colletotrichum destructivum]
MSATESLRIPPSAATVQVSIIDTTLDGTLPTAPFMGPPIRGFETWHGVGYAFLVTRTDAQGGRRRVVFDLGLPTDWANDFSPPVIEAVKQMGGVMTARKYVSEILTENGVDLEGIEAVFWSHAHPDHIGRPSLFPASTTLVVGPGVKEAYFPGWPAVQDAPVLAREFEGREVRELDFSSGGGASGAAGLEIGGLRALDYFGDGSFYLLSAPGHAVGHINALARTTATGASADSGISGSGGSNSSFIYMAGDSFHHASVLRPHAGARLPEEVRLPGFCCAGRAFHAVHPLGGNADADRTAFHTIPGTEAGEAALALDVGEARRTLAAVRRFDASPDVLVVAAHDDSLYGVVEFFPRDASGWRGEGWKESGRWLFLRDLRTPVEMAGASA